MSKFYTNEMKQYISENCKGMMIKELTEKFNLQFNTNITYIAMKKFLSKNNLKVGYGNNRKFKKEHIDFLRENVKGITLKELTKRFNEKFEMNISESSIANLKHKNNLTSGIAGGQFVKGQPSYNKGKKMPDHIYKKICPTMFKKGNIPPNWRPIGSERIDKRTGEILIKVQDGHLEKNWTSKKRYVYEKAYGKIPPKHKIIFADGNNQNLDLDNLVLVSNAEELIMNRNNLIKKDKELTKAGVNVAKVIDKINKRKKE